MKLDKKDLSTEDLIRKGLGMLANWNGRNECKDGKPKWTIGI